MPASVAIGSRYNTPVGYRVKRGARPPSAPRAAAGALPGIPDLPRPRCGPRKSGQTDHVSAHAKGVTMSPATAHSDGHEAGGQLTSGGAGHESHGHGSHGDHAAQFKDRFWWSLVLAIPVVAFSRMFARLLGYDLPAGTA